MATSEAVARIQSILLTIEQKIGDVDKVKSGILRLNTELERSELALKNARVQLVKEIQKLDPGLTAYTFAGEKLEAVSG